MYYSIGSLLDSARHFAMTTHRKQEIVTFKVDEPLWEAMKGIPNRSEFIRAAILSALDSVCPLCKGSGILTPNQRKHWETFAKNHPLEECEDCHAVHLVCAASGEHSDESGSEVETP